MKKDIEPGLEHIKKLHISAFRDARGIYNEFSRKYGQKKAHEIVDAIYDAAEQSQQDLYEKKNADYDIAMIFSGGYDADIVRRACNWIYNHKDSFGNEILEIGCDCGFITTFLGGLFPEKHITAIDRCAAGIEVAKKNVEKIGLTNIEFICDDVTNLKEKKYDTVFSMRTMHENGDDVEEYGLNELRELSKKYEKAEYNYLSTVSSLVKEGGTLISIEKLELNALVLARIQDLYNLGMYVNLHDQINCREVGDDETLQAMVFTNAKDDSSKDAYDTFIDCFMNYIDLNLFEYHGWDAKILYDYYGGEIVLGYETTDKRHNSKSLVTIKMHNVEDDCVLLYNNNNGEAKLSFANVSDIEEIIESVKEALYDIEEKSYIEIKEVSE